MEKRIALVFGYGQKENGEIDNQTADRSLKAVSLYKEGKIGKIHITTSAGKKEYPMASAMRDFMIQKGIKREDIILSPVGENTLEEISAFVSVLPKGAKVIFISTWYHIPRIKWLAKRYIDKNNFSTKASWRYANFRADILVEIKKFISVFLAFRGFVKNIKNREFDSKIKSEFFKK